MINPEQKKWLIPDTVWYLEAAIERPESDRLFSRLREEVSWTQHAVTMFGKTVACPRLSAWFGDEGASYTYSGMTLHPQPWTSALKELKQRMVLHTGASFNSVLLNLYRSGSDSMGWHADDEPELGERPFIASVSLGAKRRFRMRRRAGAAPGELDSVSIDLAHGSLLVMQGGCQSAWKHALPKTTRTIGERINLTFRQIN